MEPGEPFYPRPPTRQSSVAPSSSSQLAGSSTPRRRQRRRCQLCGSRRFHRDGSTGLIVCDEGHVLQGYREEVGDEGDDAFKSSSQRRKKDRTGIEDRKQRHKRERQRRERKFWKGARGRFLKYQCLQLLLRLQIQALKEEVPSLPDQLEAVARELWALWVSRVPHLEPRPLVEQLSHAAEKLREQQWNVEAGGSKIKAAAAAISASQREAEDRERQLLREQEDEQRDRLDEALREAGVGMDKQGEGESSAGEARQWDYPFSQDSGVESAFEDEDGETIIPRRRKRGMAKDLGGRLNHGGEKKEDPDGLATVTAILYLSLLTLRVPLLWNDLIKLIASGKMPYMHALHHLPPEMMSHLPYASVQMLDPKRVPSVMKLQSKTAYVAAKLNSAFGVEFPSVNALPMLLACTQRMLLPPTFYLAAKTLVGYANISMHAVPLECSQRVSVHRASSPESSDGDESREDEDDSMDEDMDQEAQRKAKAHQQGRLIVTVHGKGQARCAVLMAVLVVVAKMHYGLDDQERVEKASTPPTGAPKLADWLDALGSLGERLRKDTRLVYDPRGMDLFEMDEEHLDAYLDYLEDHQTLLNNHGVYDWRRREGNIDDLLSCAPGAPPIKKLREDARLGTTPGSSGPDLNSAHSQKAALSPLQAIFEHSQQSLQRLYNGKAQSEGLPPVNSTSDNGLAPGQEHAIYSLGRNFDPSKVDGPLRQVVEAACSVVGTSMEDMMMTMSAIERKLVKTLAKGKEARLASQAGVPSQQ